MYKQRVQRLARWLLLQYLYWLARPRWYSRENGSRYEYRMRDGTLIAVLYDPVFSYGARLWKMQTINCWAPSMREQSPHYWLEARDFARWYVRHLIRRGLPC